MLSLEPPYYEIDNILIYRDHAVPTLFYYGAPPPRIARSGGQLLFDLMAYTVELEHSVLSGTTIPDELGAGFLTMGTECALSPAQVANIRSQLADLTDNDETQITLYPIPYHKGNVSVLALDAYTTPRQPPGDPGSAQRLEGRPTFVEAVIGAGKPSLLGDLRCIFSLSLSQEGVVFLNSLYQEKAAPVGVVYELAFYGLRPSVEARITADLARIYEHFGGGLGVQCKWFQADIQAGLDYLRETGAISIELTSQATGEEAQKSKTLAISLFQDRIIQDLFRPTAPTLPAGVAAAAGATTAGGAGSATAKPALISLTLQYKRQEELKMITYDFRERTPEERTHSPQGFLPLLLTPDLLAQRLHIINLDHPFFDLLDVFVTGPSKEEFTRLGIRQIEATITYGALGDAVPIDQETLLFRPDATGDKSFAVYRKERKTLAYTVALAYEFMRTPNSDSDAFRYELPLQSHTGRTLSINPLNDFGVLDVEVELGRQHADVKQVDVLLHYATSDQSFKASQQLRFTPGQEPAAQQHWQVRTRQTALAPYTASFLLTFEDGVYQTPAKTYTDPLLRVDSPFAVRERELLIKPVPASNQVTQITVEIEYQDALHHYERRKLVRLDPPFTSLRVGWPIVDSNQQQLRYRVTVQEPGLISEGDWQETDSPSIQVGAESHRVGRIQVQLIGPTLSEVQLDALQINIEALLSDAPPQEPKSLLLLNDKRSDTVDLVLPPGVPLHYQYQTIAYVMDGTRRESTWTEMTSSLLVIQTRNV